MLELTRGGAQETWARNKTLPKLAQHVVSSVHQVFVCCLRCQKKCCVSLAPVLTRVMHCKETIAGLAAGSGQILSRKG